MSENVVSYGDGKLKTPSGETIQDQIVTTTSDVTVGSLATTGVVNGGAEVNSGSTATSGAGAVALTGTTHNVTTTGTGDALTLADGTEGQEIFIPYVAEGAGGDTAVITPTNLAGGTTLTLNAVGDSVRVKFNGGTWYALLGGTAAIA